MTKHLKFDRHGNPIEDDVLPDGGRLTVPMMLLDGTVAELEDWQRAIVWAHRFGLNDAADLHRPGPRRCSDEGTAAKAKAYQQMCDALQDAWKQLPPTPPAEPRVNVTGYGSGGGRGQMPGHQSTINGQPGHLNHRLECVPDRQDSVPRTMSLADAQAIRDAAYRQYCDELVNAWKAR
jgi:hypothetical protein